MSALSARRQGPHGRVSRRRSNNVCHYYSNHHSYHYQNYSDYDHSCHYHYHYSRYNHNHDDYYLRKGVSANASPKVRVKR